MPSRTNYGSTEDTDDDKVERQNFTWASSSSSEISIASYNPPWANNSSRSLFSSTDDEAEMNRLLPMRRLIAVQDDEWFGMGQTTRLCFIMLGLCSLLPWNFYITADSYWQYKFRNMSYDVVYGQNDTNNITYINSTDDAQTYLQGLHTPLLVSLSQSTNFAFLLFNAILGRRYTIYARLWSSFFIIFGIFISTTVFVKVNTDSWQVNFFIFSMCMVTLINCFGAIFQGTLFSLAGLFPPNCTSGLLQGQALSGIFSSFARIVSLGRGDNEVNATFNFLLIALLIMFVAMGCLSKVLNCEMYEHYCATRPEILYSSDHDLDISEQNSDHFKESKEVYKKIWPMSISVFIVFWITISIFPAVTVTVSSEYGNNQWRNVYFQPVMTFLLFNICDYIGKGAAATLRWPAKNSLMVIFAFVSVRIVFIPMILICNHNTATTILPVVLKHDWIYGLVVLLLGLTNGYFGTLCMIYGPSMVNHGKDIERAGSIMAASLGAGLFAGAVTSFGFTRIFR